MRRSSSSYFPSDRPTKPSVGVIAPSPGSYPVVVIDGDPEVLELAMSALRSRSTDVYTASTAEEALAHISEIKAPLVVTDMDLDGMGGLDFIAHLSRLRDDFESIVTTSRAEVDSLFSCVSLGVFRCLEKPFDARELQATLAGAANRLFSRLEHRARVSELERENSDLSDSLKKMRRGEAKRVLTERMGSVAQLASTLAHEINGPLAFMGSNVTSAKAALPALHEMLVRWQQGERWDMLEPALREAVVRTFTDVGKALDDTSSAVSLMRQVGEDLKAVSQHRGHSSEPFSLNDIVKTATRMSRSDPRSVRVELDLASEGLEVRGSRGRLIQAIMSLLSNANEATDGSRPNDITLRTRSLHDTAVIEVSDTGTGIARERIGQIFEPFSTTRDVVGGLGLDLVRQVVEEHDGTVSVDSTEGKGSTFRIVLPKVAVRRSVHPAHGLRQQIPEGVNVLFVDDDPLVRRAMARAFPKNQVRLASDGRAALTQIEEEKPDVIVSDLRMPEMDGLALYQRVAEKWPELAERILFVSGTDGFIERAQDEMPERPLLRKPIQFRDLAEKIVDASAAAAFAAAKRR